MIIHLQHGLFLDAHIHQHSHNFDLTLKEEQMVRSISLDEAKHILGYSTVDVLKITLLKRILNIRSIWSRK